VSDSDVIRRVAQGVLAFAVLAAGLSGCSDSGPGGETTCSEFLELEQGTPTSDEELADRLENGSASGEQRDILKNVLDEKGLSSDDYNLEIAYGQIVLQYCGVDDSGNRLHPNDPIENGIVTP
jgi:hypothetical protein